MPQMLPPKKDVALALLEKSNVDVYLDPRAEGVVVPPQFRTEPRLILKVGLNMPVPIPDLHVDDEGMSCTLSFNRVKFFCVVPWSTVFALVGEDGRGMVWPDDVPPELAARAAQAAPSAAPDSAAAAASSAPTENGKTTRGKASAERAAKPKRTRKKKSDADTQTAPARPVLASVPPPAPSAPRVESLSERRESARPAPSQPERPAAAGKPSAPPRRPKRELPPYLRVVK